MKTIIINTQNRLVAKELIIRDAIKSGMQYVEIEDGVLIENCLIEIKEDCTTNSSDFFLFENKKIEFVQSDKIPELEPIIPKQKRLDYKKQSKLVNDKIKKKQYYNRRRYQ